MGLRSGPRGGEKEAGPNPTDRGNPGSKDHLLGDGRGVPVSMGATAANLNDGPMWAPLLHNAPIVRPQATQSSPHHLGLDAAFANAPARQVILQERYRGHIAPKGGRSDDHPPPPGGQARRWKGSAPMPGMLSSAAWG